MRLQRIITHRLLGVVRLVIPLVVVVLVAIPAWNYLAWLAELIQLLPLGIAAVRGANKRYLAGISAERVFELMGTISFYEEAVERVACHARQGHTIVLLSGTLEVLAQIAATALECELEALGLQTSVLIRATRLVEVRGRWTGRVADRAGMRSRASGRCSMSWG